MNLSLVTLKPQIPEIKSHSLNQQELKTMKFKASDQTLY